MEVGSSVDRWRTQRGGVERLPAVRGAGMGLVDTDGEWTGAGPRDEVVGGLERSFFNPGWPQPRLAPQDLSILEMRDENGARTWGTRREGPQRSALRPQTPHELAKQGFSFEDCYRRRVFSGGRSRMRRTNELLAHDGTGSDVMRTLRFAGKFLLYALGIIAALWILGASFAFSRWAGFVLLAAITAILYATAPRWVRWLPGLLVFGVLNSLLGLITRHVPTNRGVPLSAGVAGLSLAFYAIGCIISYHYDATHLSAVDRLALLVYLFCMIWPAFAPNNLATVTPVVAWSTSMGMAALIASFVAHRARLGKRSVGA